MTIQLGTVAPIGFADFPPDRWLPCLRRLGCTSVQAYRNQHASVSRQDMIDTIRACHMPCDSLHGVFGEEYDPSAPDERARRFAVDTYKSEGELALALGGPLVVVHCSTIRRDGIGAEERAVRLAQLERSIRELGEFGQARGLRYAFENLPPYHPIGWDVGELADILRRVGAPCTGMCFDTGHANMVGDAVDAVDRTAGQMIYLHLSDNDGSSDSHEMPTYGTIDMDRLGRHLAAIAYHGTIMLEVFYPAEKMDQLFREGLGDRLARLLALANGSER